MGPTTAGSAPGRETQVHLKKRNVHIRAFSDDEALGRELTAMGRAGANRNGEHGPTEAAAEQVAKRRPKILGRFHAVFLALRAFFRRAGHSGRHLATAEFVAEAGLSSPCNPGYRHVPMFL
jgi:hypothetical protein